MVRFGALLHSIELSLLAVLLGLLDPAVNKNAGADRQREEEYGHNNHGREVRLREDLQVREADAILARPASVEAVSVDRTRFEGETLSHAVEARDRRVVERHAVD